MTDRLIPSAEWDANERYLRFQSHAEAAKASGDADRFTRWRMRAHDAYAEWQRLVKERESK